MTKHLKHIGKQLLIFALIASIFNIYALEFWCSVTMAASHHQDTASKHHHNGDTQPHDHGDNLALNHSHKDHAPASGLGGNEQDHEAKCPHQGASDKDDDCCKEQTSLFFTSLGGTGLYKFKFAPDDFQFLTPDHLTFIGSHSNSHAGLPVKLFPYSGLKPKIPDIRIFICSLII